MCHKGVCDISRKKLHFNNALCPKVFPNPCLSLNTLLPNSSNCAFISLSVCLSVCLSQKVKSDRLHISFGPIPNFALCVCVCVCVCVWCGCGCGCGVVWCGVVWCGVVWCGVCVCACVRANASVCVYNGRRENKH